MSSIQSLVIFAVIVLLIVGITLWAGRRGFCHALCWMAPFLILGRAARDRLHLPGLRLRADTKACVACGACTRACAMSFDVQGMVKRGDMSDRECILCALRRRLPEIRHLAPLARRALVLSEESARS